MSPLRAGLRVALNRPRVLGVVTIAFTLEGLLRAVLVVFSPLLALLCPPVVAVCLLGATAPVTRAAAVTPDADPDWGLETLRDRPLWRLAGAAVAGHTLALLLGTSAFLVVDTGVRAAVYALGGTVPTAAVVLLPLPAVAVATLVAWAVLIPGLARVAAGASLLAAGRASLHALTRPRRTAGTILLHGCCALVGAAAFLTGMVYTMAVVVNQAPSDPVQALALTTGLSTLAAVALGAVAYPVSVAAADHATAVESLPLRRFALAALVVSGLVAGASAVRLTETRPPPETAPVAGDLPDDATAAYAAAIERTNAVDSRVVTERGDTFRAVGIVDHDARRYRSEVHDEDGSSVAYLDAGVDYSVGARWALFALDRRTVDGRSVLATPGYWRIADHGVTETPLYGLPRPEAGEWRRVDRTNGTLTVALTGGDAVFRALGFAPPANASYETAWVRMQIDTEAGVVTGGELRLNATTAAQSFDRHDRFTVETGDTVRAERPDALGSPSPGEWLWRLFAY